MPSTDVITDWKLASLSNLSGKCYLITGGNSGVGYEAAVHLRRANADVLIACRSATKGAEAISTLRQVPGSGAVKLVPLDLASMESVRKANDLIRTHVDGLDGVVNNAGIMAPPQQTTVDGFELQLATNHLGHFLLNALTFDLVRARAGRIVPVSSMAHRTAPGINFDDPMFTKKYSASDAYSQSKLANLMYGLELARRLKAAGSSVISVSAHPGYSATNLQSTGPTGLMKRIWAITNVIAAMHPREGSLGEVLAVAGKEARNGAYYGPHRFVDSRGPIGDSTISDAAKDPVAAKQLWSLSEKLLGITFTPS